MISCAVVKILIIFVALRQGKLLEFHLSTLLLFIFSALNFTKMEWAYYAGLKICDVNRNSQKLRKYLSVLILKQSRNWHNLF